MLSAVIFGFGNVAFKIGKDKRSQKFDHMSVLSALNVEITAIVDVAPSKEALLYASEKKIPLFATYQNVLENFSNNFDLGVFCMPTSKANVTLDILNAMSFDRVLLEKPVSYDAGIAKKIFSRLRETDTKFSVNYQRNWDSGYLEVIKWIQENTITDVYCRCSTAIAQVGSHMIELIFRLFPEAEISNFLPLESKRLVGGEVKEPGAVILFTAKDTQICVNFDLSLPNEFIFSGVIYSTTGCLSFDEGEGLVRISKKQKGNKRIGSEIISYDQSEVLYKWKDEPWLYGCYQDLFSNKSHKALQDRSLQVVEIINKIMSCVSK